MSGWMPSMSLAGSSVSMTTRSGIAAGSGCWTMIPATVALGAERDDLAAQRLGGAVVAELHEPVLDPDQAAAVEDLVEVDGRGGVAADDHDGELGRVAVLLA